MRRRQQDPAVVLAFFFGTLLLVKLIVFSSSSLPQDNLRDQPSFRIKDRMRASSTSKVAWVSSFEKAEWRKVGEDGWPAGLERKTLARNSGASTENLVPLEMLRLRDEGSFKVGFNSSLLCSSGAGKTTHIISLSMLGEV